MELKKFYTSIYPEFISKNLQKTRTLLIKAKEEEGPQKLIKQLNQHIRFFKKISQKNRKISAIFPQPGELRVKAMSDIPYFIKVSKEINLKLSQLSGVLQDTTLSTFPQTQILEDELNLFIAQKNIKLKK